MWHAISVRTCDKANPGAPLLSGMTFVPVLRSNVSSHPRSSQGVGGIQIETAILRRIENRWSSHNSVDWSKIRSGSSHNWWS